jgi:hypothetical protein
MAGRQRTTFQKRQREVKRLEKQRLKAETRAARRLEKARNAALAASEIQPPVPAPK